VSIAEIPFGQDKPYATNGVGLKCLPTTGELLILTGPAISVFDNPVSISVWYNASATGFQIALGAYAELNGEFGAAGYTIRTAPEYEEGEWTRTEIVIGESYTEVTPFLVIYNSNDSDKDTVYIDNLVVSQGAELELGELVEPDDWIANLWLDEQDAGEASLEGTSLVLSKSEDKSATRFAAYFAPGEFPNRITVEVDVEKDYGETGNFSLWIGTGPSATQSDIPLQMLQEGESQTITLSAVTESSSDAMFVLVQVAGQDAELVRVTDIRIYDSTLESTFENHPDFESEPTPSANDTPQAEETPTVIATPIAAIGQVTVTDTLETVDDLSGGTDYDSDDERELVIWWDVDEDIDISDIWYFEFLVQVDGDGDFVYLGRSSNNRDEYFEWADHNPRLDSEFRDGPEFGHSYLIRVQPIQRNNSSNTYESADANGSIEFLSN
jgi:hypothetical protein